MTEKHGGHREPSPVSCCKHELNYQEKKMESNELARKVVEILEDNKAEDIVLMELGEKVDLADYFVIANGTSDRMIDALANYVADGVRDECKIHGSIQGVTGGGWMLIDYGDVIVHIFSPDRRAYYSIEELYKESKVLLRVE